MEIGLISIEDLLKDRRESLEDIINCRKALSWGVYKYSGGHVTDRIETNQKIIEKIDAELNRRKDVAEEEEPDDRPNSYEHEEHCGDS